MTLARRSVGGRLRFAPGLAAVVLFVHCASPVPVEGAGDAISSAQQRSGANPFRDGAPSRDEIVADYLGRRGIAVAVAPAARWVALDGEAALDVNFRNEGGAPFTLVLTRSHGIWPFTQSEHGCFQVEVTGAWASARHGLQAVLTTLRVEQDADVVLAPGSSAVVRVPIAFAPPAGAEAIVATLEAVLHPLAIRCGDEPERVIALRLPPVELRYGPAAVALAAEGDDAPLERALAELPEHLIAAALRRGETARAETVDRLIVGLPGPDWRGKRARCVALEWLTEQRLGDSVERWRSWWETQGDVARSNAPPGGER